jgi:hypothetical protein
MSTQQAHFIPQTYLREFSFDLKRKKVYAYNEKTGDVRPSSIDTICSRRYLYQVQDADGAPSDEIEDYLAKEVEPRYADWLALIRQKERLENSVIADLAHYVALQHVRTPTSLDHTEDLGKQVFIESTNEQWAKLLEDDERRRVMAKMEKAHPEVFAKARQQNPDAEEYLTRQDIQDIIDGKGVELQIDVGKNNIIKSMLEQVSFIAEKIVASGWNFVFAPEGKEFITTDKPAYVMIPALGGVVTFKVGGFGRPGAGVVFPLARDVCLMIEQGDYYQKFGTARPEWVDRINGLTAAHHEQYIIGHTEAVVQSLSPL